MIPFASVLALNHLLRQQPWAAERLRPFAGRTLRFKLAPMPDWNVVITEEGELRDRPRAPKASAASDAPDAGPAEADLTVTLKPSLPQALRPGRAGREAFWSRAEFTGPGDLAEALRTVLVGLEWDVEEDLSRVFGDVLAHRMAVAGRKLGDWQRDAATRLGQGFQEYWSEVNPTLVAGPRMADFAAEVKRLEADVAALEQRLETLASRRA